MNTFIFIGGIGSGMTISMVLIWFIIIRSKNQLTSKTVEYNKRTIELMEERNLTDERISEALWALVSK